jgi:transposase
MRGLIAARTAVMSAVAAINADIGTGGISKCGDRRVQTLLYEAANVMLTRYKGQLKLKDWGFAIAKRSTMRKARVALARRLAIIMHAMLRDGTEFASA